MTPNLVFFMMKIIVFKVASVNAGKKIKARGIKNQHPLGSIKDRVIIVSWHTVHRQNHGMHSEP